MKRFVLWMSFGFVMMSAGVSAWGQEDISRYVRGLKDKHWENRLSAVRQLGLSRDPRAVAALQAALADKRKEVRLAVVDALSRQSGSTGVIPALGQALGDSELEVRLSALKALGSIGTASVLPHLMFAVQDKQEQVRQDAIAAMSRVSDPAVLESLSEVYRRSGDASVRFKTVGLLGSKGDASVLPVLQQALKDAEARVRWSAVSSLGTIGLPPAVPILLPALDDPDAFVAEVAARVLGSLRDNRAVPALIAVLKRSEIPVQAAAARALGEIGDRQALPALQELLEISSNKLKPSVQEAIYALVAKGMFRQEQERQALEDEARKRQETQATETARKVELLYQAGVKAYLSGNTRRAASFLEKALALDPNHQPSLQKLAQIKAEQSDEEAETNPAAVPVKNAPAKNSSSNPQ